MTTSRLAFSFFPELTSANKCTKARIFFSLYRWVAAFTILFPLTFSTPAMSDPAMSCSANPGGNPNQPSQCAGVGNPINVMTGNKYQREDDMPGLPGVLGLELVRHYNSAFSGPDHPNGPFGRGWRLSYEIEVTDRWGKIQVLLADGGRVIFDRDRRSPTGCSTPYPANGSMTVGRQQNGQLDYTWTWTDGRKLHFNAAGKLDRITAATGEIARLLYDSQNVLVRVIDPQGRSLNLAYYDRHIPNQYHGVQFIDTPVGRFAYEYGSIVPKGTALVDQRPLLANLARVRLPDHFDPYTKAHSLSSRGTTRSTTSRIYHYEDPRSPWLMTGISIEAADEDGKPVTTRYATYGYDDTGRAILSTHANNVGKVTLDNHEAGKTVLTNSLGQKTVYRYTVIAGEYRLLEVRGAGCALCGEPNLRYGYDNAGRLNETTKLSESGEPVAATRSEHDKLGRVTRIGRFFYQRGKPQPVQLQVRFGYQGARFAPTMMARPSVVPGKELVTLIDYNEVGQPLSVTETGWAPTVDGKHAAERIERTVRYRYATINGRSLLTEIDGPLPNGRTSSPLDSDITVIEYDHHSRSAPTPKTSSGRDELANYSLSERREGLLTAIIKPGNRRNEISYDYAGRIVAVKDTEGHTSSLRYSPRGQLLAIVRDGITRSTRYDALDNPIESGYGDESHYQALARNGYDDAGRNIWTASPLGIVATRRLDTEGQLLESSTLSSTIKQVQYYEYDQPGRLHGVTDAVGRGRRIGWNASGLPDELTDALGRTVRFGYDASRNVTAVTEADNSTTRFELDVYGRPTAVIAPTGAKTRYIRDDFGRTLMTISADSGTTTRRFDAVDQLVASTDANGNRSIYKYDVMGRIVLQSVTDVGNDAKETVTTWRYLGPHLVAVDHPNQAERYDYDILGRNVTKTVILKLSSGAHVSTTTHYRYDAMGRLAGVSLPDGSMLEYRRNGQNQITALDRIPAGRTWLRWLLPQQTIIQDIERDIVGIKRLTYGNGIEAYYQRSKEGNLARIVYRTLRMQGPHEQYGAALGALLGVLPASAASAPAATLRAGQSNMPGALSLRADPAALLDHRYLWDAQGNLLYIRDKNAASSYAYDARDRLIAAATGPDGRFARYHYDGNGNRVLAQDGLADQSDLQGNTVKTSYMQSVDRWQTDENSAGSLDARYDAAGQPERIGKLGFVWDAFGKLREVRDGKESVARYRYNHRGERIEKIVGPQHTYYLYEDRKLVAELDSNGALRREYVYLADKPVVVIDKLNGSNNDGPSEMKLKNNIAATWRTLFGPSETIVYLQINHLGAVEMATDAKGKPVLQMTYSPFGGLMQTITKGTPGLQLNLRLPGQYADRETGLYYNDHRYYDPARGRYLTPDPMGLGGGANNYAYVNGNPLKYFDPEGLTLFAFDGTGNTNDQTWLAANGSSLSNIWQFRQLYGDGNRRYITGVGTVHYDQQYGDIVPATYKPTGIPLSAPQADMGANYSGPARIQRMLQYFNDEADLAADDGPMDVDIIGFSRGAAEARDFANRVIANTTNGWYAYKNINGQQLCQKVNFRFMGLFDTVLSTNYSGNSYNLAISLQFNYVAQAVALNEHRGKTTRRLLDSVGAFPLESIMGGSSPIGKKRIERGFIGSHADIGGGFDQNESQLSQVALAWMVNQAKAAGIRMTDSPLLHTIVANPVLHDKSDNQYSTNSAPIAPGIEDRTVNYRDGRRTTQMAMTGANMTWADTQKFVSYLPAIRLGDRGQMVRFPSGDYVTGTVDMRRYLEWLNKNGYDINLTIN